MDTLQKANQDINILLNGTDVLTQHLRSHQVQTYTCTVFAYLRDCLTYINQVATHTMDYVDTVTTNILSLDIITVEEIKGIIRHIESQFPSLLHLSISSDNTLHFYKYPKTHVLVAE